MTEDRKTRRIALATDPFKLRQPSVKLFPFLSSYQKIEIVSDKKGADG